MIRTHATPDAQARDVSSTPVRNTFVKPTDEVIKPADEQTSHA